MFTGEEIGVMNAVDAASATIMAKGRGEAFISPAIASATAVLMAPVALAIASDMNASPYPFAMIVALAASTAFMTPISSPVNTLVVGPGNYKFGDFVKVGVPFSLVVMVVSVILVPLIMPLYK